MVKKQNGVVLDPDSIFDVQVKRLHEYKRQQLNVLNIIAQYQALKENPNMDFTPGLIFLLPRQPRVTTWLRKSFS